MAVFLFSSLIFIRGRFCQSTLILLEYQQGKGKISISSFLVIVWYMILIHREETINNASLIWIFWNVHVPETVMIGCGYFMSLSEVGRPGGSEWKGQILPYVSSTSWPLEEQNSKRHNIPQTRLSNFQTEQFFFSRSGRAAGQYRCVLKPLLRLQWGKNLLNNLLWICGQYVEM